MKRRIRIEIRGAVQGVGFRPFVHRLARELSLTGWVANDNQGVVVELEGTTEDLEQFHERLSTEKPPPAVIRSADRTWCEPAGYRGFEIRRSEQGGARTAQVLPDIATCDACMTDVLDPANRRSGYPFTNCTHCGPRFSIIRSLPYDRPRTTMERFAMCPACRAEYEEPSDRRFHAQPNSCGECGPRLALWSAGGERVAADGEALQGAVAAIGRGEIVAVKGLGGFHLIVDAGDGEAVARLRAKKPRREKPLALMVRDLDQAREICRIDDRERALLESVEAPIVLLERRPGAPVHQDVAPGNPRLGLMLPYTPLHHLLLRSLDRPVVATSGNLSEEPICTDEREAVRRLGGVAELYLVHDRPIARHVDDSVVWTLLGEARSLRRARGYAPRPVLLDSDVPSVLAVGAHLKNTVALSVGRQVFISQHIGDMETPEALAAFRRVIEDFIDLYDAAPVVLAHDMHPDYVSTRWAREVTGEGPRTPDGPAATGAVSKLAGLPLIPVQHHHAHLAACLAENSRREVVLGVTWDGTGYGADGVVWGGEFLLGTAAACRRVAHLRPFQLPGGEAAIREPRRTALALLWALDGEEVLDRDDLAPVRSFGVQERRVLGRMLERGVNTPATTSAGRLFDGIASLIGLHQHASYEGQAAMALEHAADPGERGLYPLAAGHGDRPASGEDPPLVLDWRALVRAVLEDLLRGAGVEVIAARFHNSMAEAILHVAQSVGQPVVALTGGCFQNRLLTTVATTRLRDAGFDVVLHEQVPPNDGGISLGQVAVAAARLERDR